LCRPLAERTRRRPLRPDNPKERRVLKKVGRPLFSRIEDASNACEVARATTRRRSCWLERSRAITPTRRAAPVPQTRYAFRCAGATVLADHGRRRQFRKISRFARFRDPPSQPMISTENPVEHCAPAKQRGHGPFPRKRYTILGRVGRHKSGSGQTIGACRP
jgi:hypothetical protein